MNILGGCFRTAHGEAVPLFNSLLEDSTSRVEVKIKYASAPAADLVNIYRRRAEHVRKISLQTLGFEETVAALQSTSNERLCLAQGAGHGGHTLCVAFLADDLSEVVAVLAVLGPG